MSLVVPWRELTMACCFFARELKRLDFPTFGRPMREIASGSEEEANLFLSVDFGSSDSIFDFRTLIPCPVVAEVLKDSAGFIPRERNSSRERDEPRSDLLRTRRTGFLDFRAIFAILLSFSEG